MSPQTSSSIRRICLPRMILVLELWCSAMYNNLYLHLSHRGTPATFGDEHSDGGFYISACHHQVWQQQPTKAQARKVKGHLHLVAQGICTRSLLFFFAFPSCRVLPWSAATARGGGPQPAAGHGRAHLPWGALGRSTLAGFGQKFDVSGARNLCFAASLGV